MEKMGESGKRVRGEWGLEEDEGCGEGKREG